MKPNSQLQATKRHSFTIHHTPYTIQSRKPLLSNNVLCRTSPYIDEYFFTKLIQVCQTLHSIKRQDIITQTSVYTSFLTIQRLTACWSTRNSLPKSSLQLSDKIKISKPSNVQRTVTKKNTLQNNHILSHKTPFAAAVESIEWSSDTYLHILHT